MEQALPPALRSRFREEHRLFLAAWQAQAQQTEPRPQDRPPTGPKAPQKWGDLMDDWEL